ncbi:MAG: hypothetical protein ACI3YK_03520 [Eubacteriales bacterium]
MKKQILTAVLTLTLLLTLLSGCADPAGSLPAGGDGTGSASTEASDTTTTTTTTTTASPVQTTEPAGPVLLTAQEEGEIFYDRYLEDLGQPKSAVLVTSDGVKQFYVFSQKNGKWTKLPDRSYRGDLFWSSRIQDGLYYDFTGSGTESDYASYIVEPGYELEGTVWNLPSYFLTVDTVEVRTVCRVSFWFETTDENGIQVKTNDPTGRYEDKEEWLAAQESYLESLGFEVLTDHRYARQREGVAIEDAELLIAGTMAQFEELSATQKDGVCYHLIAASYEHYAPEEFVDVDPALIVPIE